MSEEVKETQGSDLPKVKASSAKKSLTKDTGKYVVDNILKPRAMDLVHDICASIGEIINDSFQSALNKMIYGEDRPRSKKSSGYTNYTRYSTSDSSSKSSRRDLGRRNSAQVRDIWVENKEDAIYVVDTIRDYIDKYDQAKVSDLYQLTDVPIIFTDYTWGWKDVNDIHYEVERIGEHRGEYKIVTADPVQLKV